MCAPLAGVEISKFVPISNLGLEICSNLELGSSTVWNPGSKHVEEDNLRLQICSSLRLGGLTVWHLNPNTSGGDLTWGLPRLQIEWSNGLESQSKHVEG